MGNNIRTEGNKTIITINPKVYDLKILYSAAYVFLDKAYILLDGDPEKELIITIRPKNDKDPEKMGMEFLNELINYGDYKNRSEQTKKLRESLLQRALLTNNAVAAKPDEFDDFLDELDDDYLDDPEGIAIPWEEKHGKKK